MARKRAAKQEEAGEQDAAATETAAPENGGEKMTKADAVRAALKEGIEEPEDAVKFIKDRFGIDITRPQFSTTKSLEKKRGGGGGGRGRRQQSNGAPAAAAPAALPPSGMNGPTGLATSVEAIKVLCDQLGADQVVAIAHLFRK